VGDDGIPASMRYVAVDRPGGPDVLHLATGPTPRAGAGEVVVRVAAAGANRADILQRQGRYPPPPGASPILGLEVAGTIAALGAETGRWRAGDAVCALVAGGGYAEYCAVPVPQCLPIPGSLTAVEAAALPEAFFTVWTNVFQRAHLASGETILIHGGSSGIGTAAVQLASVFGARVFATAGSAQKCDACRALGAELAVNYHEEDFSPATLGATGGRGVDVILDMVGGGYVARNIAALALEGRLVQISFLEGSRVEVDLHPIMVKRLTLTGSTLRPRSPVQKGLIARELEAQVWPLLAAGRVRPVIARTFPLAGVADAHRLMESGAHIGKIVLTL
jgi:putative PIG3 family NAD(P)H quinone oxidoreductase